MGYVRIDFVIIINHFLFVRLGICLWDDIIEYGGQQSWKYSEFYLPALARGIQDSQPEVRLILLLPRAELGPSGRSTPLYSELF